MRIWIVNKVTQNKLGLESEVNVYTNKDKAVENFVFFVRELAATTIEPMGTLIKAQHFEGQKGIVDYWEQEINDEDD